eukprot:44680-Amphidinium_carterae.1
MALQGTRLQNSYESTFRSFFSHHRRSPNPRFTVGPLPQSGAHQPPKLKEFVRKVRPAVPGSIRGESQREGHALQFLDWPKCQLYHCCRHQQRQSGHDLEQLE